MGLISRCKEFIHHCNKNSGAYSFFLAVIITGIALFSIYLLFSPLDKQAEIQLYTDLPNDELNLNSILHPEIHLFIFNAGEVPCFNINLKAHSYFRSARMVYPEEKVLIPLVGGLNFGSNFYLGIINPDETIKIILENKDLSPSEIDYLISEEKSTTLEIDCIGDSESINVSFKKNN